MKKIGRNGKPGLDSELTETVKTRIDKGLKRRLVEHTRSEERSESVVLRRALRRYLDEVKA